MRVAPSEAAAWEMCPTLWGRRGTGAENVALLHPGSLRSSHVACHVSWNPSTPWDGRVEAQLAQAVQEKSWQAIQCSLQQGVEGKVSPGAPLRPPLQAQTQTLSWVWLVRTLFFPEGQGPWATAPHLWAMDS